MEPQAASAASNSTAAAADNPPEGLSPKLRHVILIALISISFTAVWLFAYESLNKLIWENSFVTQNRWTLPVLVLSFSLIVGLAQKYLHAASVLEGGAIEGVIAEEEHSPNLRRFVGTLISSIGSLLSGASIGPEGALAELIVQISPFARRRIGIAKTHAAGFDMAALASAYNGIIGNPLFTGVLSTDLKFGGMGIRASAFLIWNLLAGVVGYLFFILLGLPIFAASVALPPVNQVNLLYVLIAIGLGIIGGVIAVFIGVSMQLFHRGIERVFKGNPIVRILAAGVVIAIVGYFFPEVLFSGEDQIHTILANPAQYGVVMLLVFAVLKVLMLALAFKSGFLGGPIFPVLFAATMVGLALSLLFPTIPLSLFVLCLEAAAASLLLRAPLTAILLVVVLGTAGQNEIALMVLSSVVAMLLGMAVMRIRALRQAGRAPVARPG